MSRWFNVAGSIEELLGIPRSLRRPARAILFTVTALSLIAPMLAARMITPAYASLAQATPPGSADCRPACVRRLAECQAAVQPARAQCEQAAQKVYQAAYDACEGNLSCIYAAYDVYVSRQQQCSAQALVQEAACSRQFGECTDGCDQQSAPPDPPSDCRAGCIKVLAGCQAAVQPGRARCEQTAYMAYLAAYDACNGDQSCIWAAYDVYVSRQQECTFQALRAEDACNDQYEECSPRCNPVVGPPVTLECRPACIQQLAQCQTRVQSTRSQCERTAEAAYQLAVKACGDSLSCRQAAYNTYVGHQQTCTSQAREQELACGQQFGNCTKACDQASGP